MSNSEVITLLSSDDDEEQPKKKRAKLTSVESNKPAKRSKQEENVVVLSDEEERDEIEINTLLNTYANQDGDPLSVDNTPDTSKADCTTVNGAKLIEDCAVVDDDAVIVGCSTANGTSDQSNSDFHKLIDDCVKTVKIASHRELLLSKVPIIKKLYRHTGDYTSSRPFKSLLRKYAQTLADNPETAIKCFNQVFQNLKYVYRHPPTDDGPSGSDAIARRFRKLDVALTKLRKMIRELEAKEDGIDDLDSENSNYIKLQTYRSRAVKIYEKMCQYKNESPHYDRITHRKLDFSSSKFTEFNWAINRRYKNNDVFPTFVQVKGLLEKCMKDKSLKISPGEFKVEAEHCFKELGNLLQKRRKQELLDVHGNLFDAPMEDPAKKDPELDHTLRENYKNGESKINEVFREFVIKQEKGDVVEEISSDSDDSHIEDSEDEESKENGAEKDL